MEELERFVESMKRGQTVATGDSLLETLRQIHDRRESPVVAHDHKQMLRDRLRRQIAERNGQPVDDPASVPIFVRPSPKRRVLQWAVAASIAVHVGLGAAILPNVEFDARMLFPGSGEDESHVIVFIPTPPLVQPALPRPKGQAREMAPKSDRQQSSPVAGNGRADAVGGSAEAAKLAPSPANRPIGPAVAPGVQPVIYNFSSSVEGLATQSLPEPSGPLPSGPLPEKIRPYSQVAVGRFERDPDVAKSWDVLPKLLVKPTPMYPDKALEYKIEGKVKLRVVFSADGRVRNIEVVRSLGYGCDEAAVEAAGKIKFMPATRNGTPVSVRTTIDVEFDIR